MITMIMTAVSKIFNFIKLNWKAILMVLGVFFLLSTAKGCYHKIVPIKPVSGPSSHTVPVLPKDDKEIITTNPTNGTTTVTNSQGSTTVTGTRGTTIEIKKDVEQ